MSYFLKELWISKFPCYLDLEVSILRSIAGEKSKYTAPAKNFLVALSFTPNLSFHYLLACHRVFKFRKKLGVQYIVWVYFMNVVGHLQITGRCSRNRTWPASVPTCRRRLYTRVVAGAVAQSVPAYNFVLWPLCRHIHRLSCQLHLDSSTLIILPGVHLSDQQFILYYVYSI
jgi:hypothetical protein